MRALSHKLLRDLVRMRGQVISIALVVACATSMFVAYVSTYASLQYSKQAYYEETQFSDVFVSLKRAPIALVQRLAEVPGVSLVEDRLVEQVTLDLPDMPEPAIGRLISLPPSGESKFNRLFLRAGRMLDPARYDEALVGEAFAKAHRLAPGDRVRAIINGRFQTLHVVGIALSPEYVYSIRPGEIIPDDAHFGVFWVDRAALESAFDMKGAFNDAVLSLAPGASVDDVIAGIDRVVAEYGGHGAYSREDQISNRFISDELKQLRVMATFLPIIFLSVAAFLLNVVLSRLVATERTQIALFKALGYSSPRIGLHYLKFVSLVVLLGTALGVAGGAWLGHAMTVLYTKYYRFPVLAYRMSPLLPVAALFISLFAGASGSVTAIARTVRLSPAVAMQPPAPPTYRRTLLERLGLTRLLSSQGRMVLRSLARRPWRTAFSTIGIALSGGLLIVGLFWQDALDYIMNVQFAAVQQEDLTVAFTEAIATSANADLNHLQGVVAAEGLRAVPVTLRAGPRSRRTELLGYPPDGHLHLLLDTRLRQISLPPEGLVLSTRLAAKLGVGVGDEVSAEIMEGRRPVRTLPVAGLVDDFIGSTAYMQLPALNRLMEEAPSVSASLLAVDPAHEADVFARLKKLPRVAGVTRRGFAFKTFRETSAQYVLVFAAIISGFAAVLVVGIGYNTARLSLAERARELASLRVLGFTRREASALLLGELGVQVLLAIPLSLVIGRLLAGLSVGLIEADAFRIPAVIYPSTYALAVVLVFFASAMSALIVRRQIDRLDLVGVLKTRE